MALSCVYRTGQRFGANYVIDVLMGNPRERILQNRHDRLSTFGIGDLDNNEWRSLFRHLVARGYLYADVDNYGAIKLDPSCKPLLAGEETLRMRRFRKPAKARKPAARKSEFQLSELDTPLLDALRLHRSELAREQAVPPYVIFHDRTLHAICELRPSSLDELAEVPGIGASKLERYGDELLRITGQFSETAEGEPDQNFEFS